MVEGLRGGIGGSSRRGTGRLPIAEPDDEDDEDDDGTEALVGRAVAEGACGVGLLVGTCLAWSFSGLVIDVVLVVAAAVAGGRTTDAIRMGEARGTGSATVSTFDTTGAETTLMAAAAAAAGTAGSAAVDTVGAAVLGSVGPAVGRLATSGALEGMIRPDGRDEEWLVDDVIVGGAGAAGMVGPGGLRVAVMARTRPPTRGESGMLHARAGGRVGEAGAAKEGGR